MIKLTFLGTGTSQGVPVVSCGCWVCTSDDNRDKRLRTSALVEKAGVTIVIDAGPDFRAQMLAANVRRVDGILLTHEHKDHINGLDDVRAFNYTTRQPVDIYAEARVLKTVRKDFDYAFCENPYPGAPEMTLHEIDETPFFVRDIEVVPIRGKHYVLPVFGFRIGTLGYLTDFNHIEESEFQKLKGIDTLVINALRKEHHMSHFTLDQALDIGWRTGAKNVYFTHISHQMGRHAQESPHLPEWAHFAYDGLSVEVPETDGKTTAPGRSEASGATGKTGISGTSHNSGIDGNHKKTAGE